MPDLVAVAAQAAVARGLDPALAVVGSLERRGDQGGQSCADSGGVSGAARDGVEQHQHGVVCLVVVQRAVDVVAGDVDRFACAEQGVERAAGVGANRRGGEAELDHVGEVFVAEARVLQWPGALDAWAVRALVLLRWLLASADRLPEAAPVAQPEPSPDGPLVDYRDPALPTEAQLGRRAAGKFRDWREWRRVAAVGAEVGFAHPGAGWPGLADAGHSGSDEAVDRHHEPSGVGRGDAAARGTSLRTPRACGGSRHSRRRRPSRSGANSGRCGSPAHRCARASCPPRSPRRGHSRRSPS